MIYIFIWASLFILISIILFYVLWINGYLIISRKASALFIGSFRPPKRYKIRFVSCNGYIKKVIKVKESRNYIFSFNSNVTKGAVAAEIQDGNKRILLQLDKDNPESDIGLEKNYRYYLVFRFTKADGEIDLAWD